MRRSNDLSDLPADDPRRKEQLRRRGPISWHLRKAEQGPAALALKNHFIAMIGEYVGTVLFMIFALGGTNVANIPTTSVTGATTAGQDGSQAAVANTSNLLYIALSFGFSLAVNAWIFFRVSGGLFNPAVSLGMVLVGALTPLRGVLLSISQILGGITGAAIIQAITPGTLNVRTTLGGGASIVQGLFIEMFLTSLLMLAILLLAAEKHKATFIAPIGIGLALFVAELLGVYYTGGSLNPARSFGPAVVLRSFSGYHWIYWVGPGLGATIAAGFYKLLKWLQYETVLGPETDEPVRVTVDATHGVGALGADGRPADEEKAVSGKTLAVSGPGLGDLLTEGPQEAVFDLERHPGPLETRLDRIEALLAQLVGPSGSSDPSGRMSSATYVDQPHSQKTVEPTYASGVHAAQPAPQGNGSGCGQSYSTNTSTGYGQPAPVQGGVQGHGDHVGHQAHVPFAPGVAGAGDRPHIDVDRR